MNKVLMLLLLGVFILTGSSFAQTPPAAAAPAAAPTASVDTPTAVAPEPTHHHDHFPELHKAMRKLRSAKLDLEKAAHDYDGHKAKAIAAIEEALAELKEATLVNK